MEITMTEITKEEIQKMIEEAVNPLNEQIEELRAEIELIGDVIGRDGGVILGEKEY